MAFDDKPNKLDAVFIQRTPENEYYEQINISASDAIVYLNEKGKIDVDKISDWASKYGIGTTGQAEQSTFSTNSLYSISSSWASRSISSSYTYFNGERPITRNDPDFYGLNVGGITVTQFLENFFFPFRIATVAITTPSSTAYYETGSIQSPSIVSTITPNDETVFGTGSVRRDGLIWNTIASIPPYTPSFTDTNISSSHIYKTYIQVGNNGSPTVITSSTRAISFIYPYLYGLSSTAGLSGTTLYTTMVSKSIITEQDKGDYFWGTGTYIYFCYPSTYSSLTSILDPNSFELLPSFEHSSSVPVTSSGLPNNWQRLYHVYRLKLLASPCGSFQFIS